MIITQPELDRNSTWTRLELYPNSTQTRPELAPNSTRTQPELDLNSTQIRPILDLNSAKPKFITIPDGKSCFFQPTFIKGSTQEKVICEKAEAYFSGVRSSIWSEKRWVIIYYLQDVSEESVHFWKMILLPKNYFFLKHLQHFIFCMDLFYYN